MILLQGPHLASQRGEYPGLSDDCNANNIEYVPSEWEEEELDSESDDSE